jgi:hypothetical protein
VLTFTSRLANVLGGLADGLLTALLANDLGGLAGRALSSGRRFTQQIKWFRANPCTYVAVSPLPRSVSLAVNLFFVQTLTLAAIK